MRIKPEANDCLAEMPGIEKIGWSKSEVDTHNSFLALDQSVVSF